MSLGEPGRRPRALSHPPSPSQCQTRSGGPPESARPTLRSLNPDLFPIERTRHWKDWGQEGLFCLYKEVSELQFLHGKASSSLGHLGWLPGGCKPTSETRLRKEQRAGLFIHRLCGMPPLVRPEFRKSQERALTGPRQRKHLVFKSESL